MIILGIGTNAIIITYQSHITTLNIEIVAEAIATNSNFDKAICNVNSVKYYTFSNPDTQEYMLIDISLDEIVRNTENDSYEYYYYLSSNQDESNIQDWVKINEEQSSIDKLEFQINTNDIKNYEELSTSNTLYLYIREVVTKGGNQSVFTSNALNVDSDITLETYLDNVKLPNANSGNIQNSDDTTSPNRFPNAGIRNILILISVVLIASIVFYIKYRNLNKYVK